MPKVTKEERDQATATLKKWLPVGTKVYTRVEHASKSGMTRDIVVLAVVDGEIVNLSYHVAKAVGWTLKDNAVRVRGCGMDMGFHLVYELSCHLFGQSFDSDHGYKLKQVWI